MSTTTSTSSYTASTDPGDRSAAEIEREVEATRAGLSDTLDQLKEKASPGQLFEQAVDWARSSGGSEMMRNLGAQVRENPLPLLLIGAGIGWMMLSGGGGGGRRDDRYAAHPARPLALPPPGGGGDATGTTYGGAATSSSRVRVYPATSTTEHAGEGRGPSLAERASAAMGSAAQGVGDTARSAADGVTGAARSVADSVGGAAERAAEAAGEAWRSVTGAASSATEGLGSTASSAARSVTETGYALHGQAREGLGWMIREQPLVLGAIGVAVGAAIGALLPGTETEDRLMGETRDSLVDQASTVAQQGYERIKDTAGEHLGRAQHAVGEAADQGGVSRLGEVVGEAARAAREAVRDAAHDLAGEAKSAIGTTDEGQQRTAAGAAASPPPQPGGPQTSGPQRGGGPV